MNKTIIIKLLLSIMLFTYVSVEPTGASFSDKEINTNNTITSGWWKEPEVTITMPEGGEIYSLGDIVPIEWEVTLADPTSNYIADVYISKDSGTNYDQVANDLDNATNYDWEIPNDPAYKTTHMRVKVVIEDDHNLIGQDESEEFDPIDLEEVKEEVNKEEDEEVSKKEIENEANIPTEEEKIIEKDTIVTTEMVNPEKSVITMEEPKIEQTIPQENESEEEFLIDEKTEDTKDTKEEEIEEEQEGKDTEEKKDKSNTEKEEISEEKEESIE